MKFFKLLYICLMSFIASPFLHSMDFGRDFFELDVPSESKPPISDEKSRPDIPMETFTTISPKSKSDQNLFEVLYSHRDEPPAKYLVTSIPTKKNDRLLSQENNYITKNDTFPLLKYPTIDHPVAEVFVNIDYAKVRNSEDLLVRALQSFKRNPRRKPLRFIVNPDLLRINESNTIDQLKEYIFKQYLFDPSQTDKDLSHTATDMCQTIPHFFKKIYEYQQLKAGDSYREKLLLLTQSDLVNILYHLTRLNESLNANTQLIYDIITKTTLDRQKTQACLLLLNKIGNFYPQIKSDLATTLLDDIAIHYSELLKKQESQEQKDEFISQAIKLLNITPLLEPLFSGTLPISAIPNEELEDYLEKIQLLELNTNPSPSAKEKLTKIEIHIFKEVDKRTKQAAVAAQKAKMQAIEKAQLESSEKVQKAAEAVNHLKAEQTELQKEKERLETEKQLLYDNITIKNAQKRIAEKEPVVRMLGSNTNEPEVAQQAYAILQEHRQKTNMAKQAKETATIEAVEEANRKKHLTPPQQPSFFQNLLPQWSKDLFNTIQSWFNWLSWEQYKS